MSEHTGSSRASGSLCDHAVWMVCNNCGHADTGKNGAMYECRQCGWGDGWGAEDHAEAERISARIQERGRFDAA